MKIIWYVGAFMVYNIFALSGQVLLGLILCVAMVLPAMWFDFHTSRLAEDILRVFPPVISLSTRQIAEHMLGKRKVGLLVGLNTALFKLRDRGLLRHVRSGFEPNQRDVWHRA